MPVSAYMDLTAMNAALKELYSGQVINNMVYADNPLFAMLPKFTEFGGKYYPQPIITGNNQGVSATFATAQTNQSAAQLQSFLLTRVSQYSIATIDNQTMLASKTDKMAFLEGAKLVIDSAIRSATNQCASGIFRSGTGSIGAISSISTGVITLSNALDVVQFENNMVLQANATDGGTPRAALGYVIAVDRALGKVTVASSGLGGSAATPSGWTTADFLLIQGDVNLKPTGLAAWLPTTAPTGGDNFFGVDRSVDSVRLAGVRYDGSAQSIEEAMIDATALVAREGGKVGKGITNFASYSALEKALGSKVQYVNAKGPADIAFRGMSVNGANSVVDIFPDRNCQAARMYMLQMDTWRLMSLGDCPQILKYGDGLEMLRVSNADAGELRVGAYYQLSCAAPGWNAVVSLSA